MNVFVSRSIRMSVCWVSFCEKTLLSVIISSSFAPRVTSASLVTETVNLTQGRKMCSSLTTEIDDCVFDGAHPLSNSAQEIASSQIDQDVRLQRRTFRQTERFEFLSRRTRATMTDRCLLEKVIIRKFVKRSLSVVLLWSNLYELHQFSSQSEKANCLRD